MTEEFPPIYTIGHSTLSIEEFVALLKVGSVGMVVDIRKTPRSRTNPQFNIDTLPGALAGWQIGYDRIADLGGRRAKSASVPLAVNAYWTNQSFHNYADYTLSAAFRFGLSQLAQISRERRVAVMCSEAVWWRCHRRFVADYLLHEGRKVFHLMSPARADAASLTPSAREQGASLVYPRMDGSPEG